MVLFCDPPQCAEIGVTRVAVVQNDRGTSEQTGDQQVPHHPAGGREPEEPLARAEVVMESVRLQMLDDDSAVPVHDPLWEPRGTRGIQDPERMVERHGVVFKGTSLSCQLRPARCTIQLSGSVEVGHQHCRAQARYLLTEGPDAIPYVEGLPAIAVAVDGEQDDQVAPRLATARKAATASTQLGKTATTRSPRPMPSRNSPTRTLPTR